jgi:hypothetical protein
MAVTKLPGNRLYYFHNIKYNTLKNAAIKISKINWTEIICSIKKEAVCAPPNAFVRQM